jgi:polar amino acid transport system permease protein
MEGLIPQILFVGKGIFITGQLLVGGILIGLILGTFFAVLRYKAIGITLINRIISILRGTPLILQLSIVYFSVPGLLGIKLSIVTAGILTFGINSSAYVAEILRAGIENLPKGQFEAAKTLKVPNYYMWKDIILPQVIKNVLPTIINEVIALLKETALITTIGGMDLMRSAQVLAAEQFTYFMPLCIAGGYYYGLVLLIEYVGKKVEQKWQDAEENAIEDEVEDAQNP